MDKMKGDKNRPFLLIFLQNNNNKKFAKIHFLMKISYHKPKNPFSSSDLLNSVINGHADGLSIFTFYSYRIDTPTRMTYVNL